MHPKFSVIVSFWKVDALSADFIKREIRTFHDEVLQQQKCTKKRDARAKLLFCLLNLFLFCRSHCRRRRSSSLNDKVECSLKEN